MKKLLERIKGLLLSVPHAVDEWRKPGAWSYADLLATILGGLVIQIEVWIA